MTLYARARLARVALVSTSHVLTQVADTFRPATNLLPSLSEAAAMAASSPHMTRAILLRSVNSNHSTDHLQGPGRALCTSHSPGLRAAMVLCCLPRTRPPPQAACTPHERPPPPMPQSSASYTHDIHTRATVLYQNLETESRLDHDLRTQRARSRSRTRRARSRSRTRPERSRSRTYHDLGPSAGEITISD